jgi:hypothetical protein
MAFQMTLGEAKEALARAKNAMGKVREKAEEAIGHGIEVAEVGGTAFGFGYANAKWGDDGELKMFGGPVDLGVGIALTGVAMFGGLGRYAEHGVNVGAGAIAAYAYRTGYQLGAESNDSASDTTTQTTSFAPAAQSRRMGATNGASHTTAGAWDPQGQTYTVYEHQGA